MSGFRLQSAQLFLTYPQCDLDREFVLEQITAKLATKSINIVNHIVAQEKHADGNFHIHVYLKLHKKCDVRDAAFFDISHPNEDKSFHGNYQGVRSVNGVRKYVQKDGNFISNLSTEEIGIKTNVFTKAIDLTKAGSYDEALEVIQSDVRGSRDFLLHGDAIEKNLSKFLPIVPKEATHSVDDFDWEDQYWNKKTTLILYGPTNTGKTTLAQLLLPDAFLVGHMDDLKGIKPSQWKNGLIFDDMSFVHLHDEAQIHLLDYDHDRTIHCRFANARIPAGTLKIITTNKDPSNVVALSNPAIKRRVTVISVPEQGQLDFPDEYN